MESYATFALASTLKLQMFLNLHQNFSAAKCPLLSPLVSLLLYISECYVMFLQPGNALMPAKERSLLSLLQHTQV